MTEESIHDLEPQLAANRAFWCGWVGSLPDTDLPVYRANIDHALFNGVLRIRNRSLDEAIDDARKQLSGSRWSWWVGSDSDKGTADALLARGAEQTSNMPIMAVDVTAVPEADAPEGFSVRVVSDVAQLSGYVRAYAKPLGIQGKLGPLIDLEQRYVSSQVIRLAGIVDGRTVGTCTLSLATDVGALYCIATDGQYRRRGIATALTLEALRLTRESGRRIATLQASSEGERVYRRIGFETVGRYRLFKLPE